MNNNELKHRKMMSEVAMLINILSSMNIKSCFKTVTAKLTIIASLFLALKI